jgi:sporulation protein YlmC with PRC-barrel domain
LGTTALIPISAMAQTNNQATQPGAQGRATPQANQQGLAAGQLRNQPLYTQAGQEFGRVNHLVRDRQGRNFLVVLRGNEYVLVPAEQLRHTNGRFVLTGITGNERLQAFSQQVAANYEMLGTEQRIAIAGYEAEGGDRTQQAEASRILVQPRAPAVQFQQAAPQITVRQPQPTVNVGQAAPEILVQQPPPVIRVELPQPQITVRMPKPEVNVAMAQPQVQVRQPQPQVQMAQPQGAPAVQVQREQAQVQVQRAQEEAQVQVQQGQPVVRYERTGEPRVIYNQAPGQPVVRVERADQEPGAQARSGSTTQAATQRQGMTEQERQRAQQRLIVEDVDAVSADQANVKTRPVVIRDLDDMEVYNARGEELGEVGRVVLDPRTKRQYVVVESGGFLGIGEDRVAFPLDRFWMRGDRLVLRGVTEEDIDAMDDYRDQIRNYRQVADTDRVDLRLWD